MASGYGMAGHIGVGKETTWGTAVAATDYVEAMSESMAQTFDRFETKNIIGRLSEADDEQGVQRIAGDVVMAAHAEAMLPYLIGGTGIQSNSEVLSGLLHTHTLTMATADTTPATNPLMPLSLEVFRDVTSSQQYDGCQISQLVLAGAPNQDLRLTASIIGKGSQFIAKTTPSFVSSPVGPFTFDTCSISLSGAGTALIEGFSLTINNQLEGIPSMNASSEIAKIKRTGMQQIRFSGSLAYEDIVEANKFIAETESAVAINFTAANSHSFLITLPRFLYTAFPTGMGDRGRQVISFDGTGRYHVGSLTAIQLQLTNTTSGF